MYADVVERREKSIEHTIEMFCNDEWEWMAHVAPEINNEQRKTPKLMSHPSKICMPSHTLPFICMLCFLKWKVHFSHSLIIFLHQCIIIQFHSINEAVLLFTALEWRNRSSKSKRKSEKSYFNSIMSLVLMQIQKFWVLTLFYKELIA